MKYLDNFLNNSLSNKDHLSNRIKLAAAAMFKLNEAGYDENLDAFTATQLYKTYGRPTLLYGIENLKLNGGELDRLVSFETSLIKRILKFAPFHHSDMLLDMLLDAIKMNTLSEKIELISCAVYIRIINNEYTNNFTRELLRATGGVTTQNSILRPVLEMVSTSPLNRFLIVKEIKEYASLKLETIKNKCKLRFEMDEQVQVIRGMLWHLADYKSLVDEMLEPINYRFPDRLMNDRPYDHTLF
jgi:hypothetical protein